VREGINIFLAGFVPTENLRFRDEALTFKVIILLGYERFSLAIGLECADGESALPRRGPHLQS